MRTIKLTIIAFILALLVTFSLQNAAVVDIKFLTYQLSVPRGLLIGITYMLGILSGLFLFRFRSSSSGKVF